MIKHFSSQGLRMIELHKEDLKALVDIFNLVHALAIRFIIFIDDLSFESMSDEYTMLKNVLEGSVLKQPDNILIYVTSNRRHLVSETFHETQNALYENDVRSERLSLAERFGLRLRFTNPQKQDYLKLIKHSLQERGIELDPETENKLEAEALADSVNEASMSPRNAVRFLRKFLAKGEEHVQ